MLTLNVKQITLKNALIVILLLTHDLAGRAASAHREFLGTGGSTKDKDDGGGGKHLRVLSAPVQEGSEDIVLGSTSKNPIEVPVSDILFEILLSLK